MIGYHASHEQYAPSQLLHYVQQAAAAGFECGMCSDHFHPWTGAQGQSGFAWSWLGAALQATQIDFGVVNAPGYRYHPAIIAQAAATLGEMFPGRFWMAAGSGEWLNEHITGGCWPIKSERNERLRESVEVMRALWRGETVTHHGRVIVEEARLYTLPALPLRVLAAALTSETAQWAGAWADGLITTVQPYEKMQQIIAAFREGGGEGKPLFLQAQIGYAKTEEESWKQALGQWRALIAGSAILANLRTPAEFEELGRLVGPEDLKGHLRISNDLGRHREWLQRDVELGFDRIFLHNVALEQERFIEDFGARVLPGFQRTRHDHST